MLQSAAVVHLDMDMHACKIILFMHTFSLAFPNNHSKINVFFKSQKKKKKGKYYYTKMKCYRTNERGNSQCPAFQASVISVSF